MTLIEQLTQVDAALGQSVDLLTKAVSTEISRVDKMIALLQASGSANDPAVQQVITDMANMKTKIDAAVGILNAEVPDVVPPAPQTPSATPVS